MSVKDSNNINEENKHDLDDPQQGVENTGSSGRRNMLKKAVYVAPIITTISFSDRALASGGEAPKPIEE